MYRFEVHPSYIRVCMWQQLLDALLHAADGRVLIIRSIKHLLIRVNPTQTNMKILQMS
jgi:hypothetical protein